MSQRWTILVVAILLYLGKSSWGQFAPVIAEESTTDFVLPLDVESLSKELASATPTTHEDLLNIEKECFTAFLNAHRFKRRCGSIEWEKVKNQLLRLYLDARNRVAAFPRENSESRRIIRTIDRYISELKLDEGDAVVREEVLGFANND